MGGGTIEGLCEMFSVSVILFPSYCIFIHEQKLEGKVCLSLDAWTLSNQYTFLAIVAHYVTNDGQLGSCSC